MILKLNLKDTHFSLSGHLEIKVKQGRIVPLRSNSYVQILSQSFERIESFQVEHGWSGVKDGSDPPKLGIIVHGLSHMNVKAKAIVGDGMNDDSIILSLLGHLLEFLDQRFSLFTLSIRTIIRI